jgi:predicted transglutaminase-like cysteine proteinase
MSGFAPILRIAPRAAPVLLLTLQSGAAFAQAPASAAVLSSTTSGAAYGQADRLASTLLAGGMSRLTAISAQQGSGSSLNWASPLAEPQAVVNGSRVKRMLSQMPGWELQGVRLMLNQSSLSYKQPDLVPAFMRGLMTAPAATFVMPKATPLPSAPAPRAGQPDIFGSVAMAVSRTPLDDKWAAIARSASAPVITASFLRSARAAAGLQQVEMVNRWVNSRLRFADDQQGRDSWASASQSLQRGVGDCEDYAIAKMQLLEAAGFDRRAMFLVIARDLVRQADHAVLAVRLGHELLVLDNMTDRVLPSSAVSDYRPIMSFNAYGRWTHGYRVTTPHPVQFAAR